MMSEQKRKIQTVVICGLLLLSSIDVAQCAKSKSGNKQRATTARPKISNSQHANPAAFSYSGVSPNAPQQSKTAPKLDQRPSQALPYPQSSNTNQRPVGWDVNSQNRPQSNLPYPTNTQQRPQSAPYPVNNQQQSPPYPVNNQQSPPYPVNQAPVSSVQHTPNYNQNPQQPAYNPSYNPNQQMHNQPAYNPNQAGYNPSYNPSQQMHSPYNPQPGGYNPQPGGYNPQPQPGGYNPQPGYAPQPAYAPQQPQIIHQVVPVQQQSSGPGLLKTVAVGAAAGLGTSLLYNSLTKKDEPTNTIIYVNNTQPIQPAPPAQAEVSAPQQTNTQAPIIPIQDQNQNYNGQTYQQPQQFPNQAQSGQIPQQYPAQQEQPQFNQQQFPVNQYPGQPSLSYPPQTENSQASVENLTVTPLMAGNTESTVQSQTGGVQAEMSTVSSTSMTPEKAVSPVDALNSRATESANLRDTMASKQPVNTQLSMLILALSCTVSYLMQ